MARFRLEPGPFRSTTRSTSTCGRRSTRASGGRATGCRPSESWPRHYGCSLITVRRALDELAREERIERTRGRGTFVTRPHRPDLDGPRSFTEEMQHQGLDPGPASSRARTDGRRRVGGRPRDRARRADAVRRAPAAGRRRTAPARAGPSARGAIPRPARARTSRAPPSTSCSASATARRSPGPARRSSRSPCGRARRPARPQSPIAGAPRRGRGLPLTAFRSSTPARTSGATGCATTSNESSARAPDPTTSMPAPWAPRPRRSADNP